MATALEREPLKGEIVAEGDGPNLDSLQSASGNSTSANGHDPQATNSRQLPALEHELHPVYDYLLGLSPRSRKTQESALRSALSVLASPWLRERYGDSVGASQSIRERPRDEWLVIQQSVYEYPWNQLGRVELKAIIVAWREFGLAAKTITRSLAAVRRVLWICTKSEYRGTRWQMTKDAYAEATDKDDLPRLVTESGKVGRAFTQEELSLLFRACDIRQDGWEDAKIEYPANTARDKAFFGLQWLMGLRVTEACNLKMNDYNPRTGELNIRKGKTGDRTFTLSAPAKIYLDQWLDHRLAADPRPHDGPIFYRVSRGGVVEPWVKHYDPIPCPGPYPDRHGESHGNERIGCGFDFRAEENRRFEEVSRERRLIKECPDCGIKRPFRRENQGISPQAVRAFLEKRCDMAGIPRATTHDGRRTFATTCLENGMLPYAQAVLGHKDKATTLGYWRYSTQQFEDDRAKIDQIQAAILGLDLEAEAA